MLPAHPLPNSYWILPGQFLAGAYPHTSEDLQTLIQAGINFFVDLTEPEEGSLPQYAHTLKMLARPLGTRFWHQRIPIPDMSCPSPQVVRAALTAIHTALSLQRRVYLHCYGGIGRTGTIVGCYLVQYQHISGEQALEQIRAWRRDTPNGYRTSPETEAQHARVLTWGQEKFIE
ncbi:MAG: protein-tyrosine phosphatase family protein [Anaerolineales bacterium]